MTLLSAQINELPEGNIKFDSEYIGPGWVGQVVRWIFGCGGLDYSNKRRTLSSRSSISNGLSR